MKRLVLFLFVAVLMVGCATTYYDSEGNPVSKEKMSQLRATAVKAHLAEHRYRVFVDRMYPMRGPAVYLQDDWGLEVSGRRIFMTTRNDFESYQIVLEVFDNATVSLVINPSERETISFSGVMELNDVFTPKGQKASKKHQTTFMKL